MNQRNVLRFFTNLNKSHRAQFSKAILTLVLLFVSSVIFAQTEAAEASNDILATRGNQILVLLMTAILILVVFMAIVLSDKMIKISASSSDTDAGRYNLLPNVSDLFPRKKGKYSGNAPVYRLKEGFDVRVQGPAEKKLVKNYRSNTYAIKPTDWNGLQPIPKLMVAEGDEVKAGDQIFYDKKIEGIFWTAPISGEVVEIRRGAKRAITEVVILADKQTKYKDFGKMDVSSASREDVVSRLLESGAWTFINQRPFGLPAEPNVVPKAIHISGFDSSPLAADYNFVMQGKGRQLQDGINVLRKLTEGKVHLNLNAKRRPADAYQNLDGVQVNWFEGRHPAGVVGVQIHHIDPIMKGDVVWTVNVEDVITLGRVFTEGVYDPVRTFAVAGPEVKDPKYYQAHVGVNLKEIVEEQLENEHVRAISGNVLTGDKISKDGHLGSFSNVVSIIQEGDFYEFIGWLLPSYPRPSLSVTFPWTLFPFERFRVNTNTHGEQRAFVVTGQYEEVLPMNLYPVHLLKAILANDFEKMEGLGIYEVIEEDLAICEFVCTSKQPVQTILRDGIDYMIEQS
jgi:Na+-transporting NADH:ubiquinone oxidoreductase subunit A